MSANVEAKKQIVEEIKAKIQASKSVVFADYNKLTVLEVTALRNEFKNANCEYKVYKNTLVRKAFNELGYSDFDADLNGPTAVVFCADETRGAAILQKLRKQILLWWKRLCLSVHSWKTNIWTRQRLKNLQQSLPRKYSSRRCSAACNLLFPNSFTFWTLLRKQKKQQTNPLKKIIIKNRRKNYYGYPETY